MQFYFSFMLLLNPWIFSIGMFFSLRILKMSFLSEFLVSSFNIRKRWQESGAGSKKAWILSPAVKTQTLNLNLYSDPLHHLLQFFFSIVREEFDSEFLPHIPSSHKCSPGKKDCILKQKWSFLVFGCQCGDNHKSQTDTGDICNECKVASCFSHFFHH